MGIWVGVHLLAATIWVGGMYFAHRCLRPAAELHLAPPLRLVLWSGVLRRFFSRIWMVIAMILISGYIMVFTYMGGMAEVGVHIHLMQVTGWAMIGIYLHIYLGPYRRFKAALDEDEFEAAAAQLAKVRKMVGINLTLGLITMLLGASGRYLEF